jgi:hypothetical protein
MSHDDFDLDIRLGGDPWEDLVGDPPTRSFPNDVPPTTY